MNIMQVLHELYFVSTSAKFETRSFHFVSNCTKYGRRYTRIITMVEQWFVLSAGPRALLNSKRIKGRFILENYTNIFARAQGIGYEFCEIYSLLQKFWLVINCSTVDCFACPEGNLMCLIERPKSIS